MWTLTIGSDGTSGEITDHEGTVITTLQAGGEGFSQGALYDVMWSEFDTALANANRERAIRILGEALFGRTRIENVAE